jgi:hypothetical protein
MQVFTDCIYQWQKHTLKMIRIQKVMASNYNLIRESVRRDSSRRHFRRVAKGVRDISAIPFWWWFQWMSPGEPKWGVTGAVYKWAEVWVESMYVYVWVASVRDRCYSLYRRNCAEYHDLPATTIQPTNHPLFTLFRPQTWICTCEGEFHFIPLAMASLLTPGKRNNRNLMRAVNVVAQILLRLTSTIYVHHPGAGSLWKSLNGALFILQFWERDKMTSMDCNGICKLKKDFKNSWFYWYRVETTSFPTLCKIWRHLNTNWAKLSPLMEV